MKKLIILCLGILLLSLSNVQISARPASEADYRYVTADGTVILIWRSGSSSRGSWGIVDGKPVGGGHVAPIGSSQCNSPGSECFMWDWMREINGIHISDPGNPFESSMEIMTQLSEQYPEVMEPSYGYNNSSGCALENEGIEIPEPNEFMQRFITYNYDGFSFWWEW